VEKEMVLKQIRTNLTELCVNISNRHVGSPGNSKAGEYTAQRLSSAGFTVAKPEFDCIDWEQGEIILKIGGIPVEAFISPYSPSCEIDGLFEIAANMEELANRNFSGKIAVFHGELCKEQVMPRNYVNYPYS
jgi:aminopeptidase YwaD